MLAPKEQLCGVQRKSRDLALDNLAPCKYKSNQIDVWRHNSVRPIAFNQRNACNATDATDATQEEAPLRSLRCGRCVACVSFAFVAYNLLAYVSFVSCVSCIKTYGKGLALRA